MRQLSPRKNLTDESVDNHDKNKLINVDKNEAYKGFIETDGMEESNKILKNMVIRKLILEWVQDVEKRNLRLNQVSLGNKVLNLAEEREVG